MSHHGLAFREKNVPCMSMASNVSVSVVVPTLNSASTLNKTLESIYNQICLPTEVILVDGFSTDRSLDIFNSFRRECDQIITAPRCGPYAAMNIGINHARCEIVAILNSDDYWASIDLLQVVTRIFRENNERLAVLHGDIQVQTQEGKLKSIIKPSARYEIFCGLGLPFCHPAAFIRRDAYLLYGKYNWISFPNQADRDFGFRLNRHHVDSIYIPKVFTIFRTGGLSCNNYDKQESARIISTLPPLGSLVGRVIGTLTEYHPQYYSGHNKLNIMRHFCDLLRIFLTRVMHIVTKH